MFHQYFFNVGCSHFLALFGNIMLYLVFLSTLVSNIIKSKIQLNNNLVVLGSQLKIGQVVQENCIAVSNMHEDFNLSAEHTDSLSLASEMFAL